jgi:hypothetical protein
VTASGNGILHLGPSNLYVSKPTELGVTVLGVKYGKVDLDKISSIGIGTMTTQNRVTITVHLKDGSAGSYEVKRQSQQKVLELLLCPARVFTVQVAHGQPWFSTATSPPQFFFHAGFVAEAEARPGGSRIRLELTPCRIPTLFRCCSDQICVLHPDVRAPFSRAA